MAAGDRHFKDLCISIFQRSVANRTFIVCIEHNVLIILHFALVLTLINTDADILSGQILKLLTLLGVKASILELLVLSSLLFCIDLMVIAGHNVHYR